MHCETVTSQESTVSKLDIRGAAGKGSPSALHACLSSARPSAAALLATGSLASPSFAEAVFEDSAGALLPSSVVGVSPAGEEDEPQEDEVVAGTKGALSHVVGPGELGIRGVEKDVVSHGEGIDEDGRFLKRLKAGREEGGEASLSIAERLEALSAAIDEEAEKSGSGKARGDGVLALMGGGADEGAIQPRAESLSTVLTQALQSGDESLLEQCLAVGDQSVIEATVERLPSSKVLPFLLRYV